MILHERKRGRPTPIAPPGYVTIRDAAERAGASYSTVYRAVTSGVVGGKQQGHNGPWFVLESGIAEIAGALEKGDPVDDRHAVMLRPTPERYARWERAAGKDRVSTWVAGLADAASSRAGGTRRKAPARGAK